MTQRGRPQTKSGCPDRGAGQESETQIRGDKTTFFICPEIQGWLARFRHLVGCGTVVYRSFLARYLRYSSGGPGPVGPRKWSEVNRTRFWRVFWQPGGALPESGLASSLAGVVPGGVSTRWCGAGGELVKTSTASGKDPEAIWRRSECDLRDLVNFRDSPR
jgi:hypothetical protein